MPDALRKEFRVLPREELLQKVYDFGVAYESHSFSCSQSAVAALYRVLDFPSALVKASCSNAGGTAGHLVGTCGGVVGGMMVLDYFTGRPFEHMSDKEVIEDPNVNDLSAAIEVAKWLPKKYMEEYGSINCVNIQFQIYGRPFYLEDPDEMQKLEEAGGHSNPEKCPRVVGNAAKWTMEILLDKGAVTLG